MLAIFPEDSDRCVCRIEKKADQVKKEPAPKLSFSEFMTKKIAPAGRLEKVNLFPEEGPPVILPAKAYLNRLEAEIPANWPGNAMMMVAQRIKCENLLGEVRKGYRDITSRLNPVYGRPIFTKEQLAYIRWSERQIADLLQSLEYECIRLTREERKTIAF